MKILTAILIAALLALSGCGPDQTAAFTALTGQNTDLDIKLGALFDANDGGRTEAGVVVKYLKKDEIKWGPEPDILGGYVKFYLSQEITITDTPEPSLIQPWLEAFKAQPYIGFEIVGSPNGTINEVQHNWILGTAFTLSDDTNISLNIEYIDGDQAHSDVYLGMGYKF